MMHTGVAAAGLAIASLGAAGLSGTLLLRSRRLPNVRAVSYLTEPESDAAHLAMLLGMSAMLAPLEGLALGDIPMFFFAAIAAPFGMRLIMGASNRRWHTRRASSMYHFVAALAMTYAALIMPGDMGHSEMVPMAGHSGVGAVVSLSARALAAVFGLDLVGTLVLVLVMPRSVLQQLEKEDQNRVQGCSGGQKVSTLREDLVKVVRVASIPHLVMDLGMIFMLLN